MANILKNEVSCEHPLTMGQLTDVAARQVVVFKNQVLIVCLICGKDVDISL